MPGAGSQGHGTFSRTRSGWCCMLFLGRSDSLAPYPGPPCPPPREHPCRFVANPSLSRVPDSLVKLCLLLLPRPPPGPATPSTVHPLPRHDTAFPIHLDHAPAADHGHGHGHDHDHACDPTTLLACSRPDTTANKSRRHLLLSVLFVSSSFRPLLRPSHRFPPPLVTRLPLWLPASGQHRFSAT